MKAFQKAFLLGMMLILVVGIVCATPGTPHRFGGEVTVNGKPAPDGTKVTATVDGVKAEEGVTSNGEYGKDITLFQVEDPNADRAGKTIKFYVKGKNTGITAIFTPGDNTELDLAVTITEGGTTPSGGGGSGGGGGGGGGLPPGDLWDCEEWSECVKGEQTQKCTQGDATKTDKRECEEKAPVGTDTLPSVIEVKSGDEDLAAGPGSPETAAAEEAEVTGAATGTGAGTSLAFLIVLVVVIAALVALFVMRKKRTPKAVKGTAKKNKTRKSKSRTNSRKKR